MIVTNNKGELVSNILSELEILQLGVENFELLHFNDRRVRLFCGGCVNRIEVVKRVIKQTNLNLALELSQNVNSFYKRDFQLSGVCIEVLFKNRELDKSKMAILKISL